MCLGPLRKLCHWGPLLALFIIKCISLSMWHCSSMWWPPKESLGGLLNFLIFTLWNATTLYNFFSAMLIGPGFLPRGWKPDEEDDEKYLQYCSFCQGYKAPRSHHCRKCQRCVLKMDHHCPWINNCCGHNNHAHFSLFLFCAVMGCLQASIVLACSLYRALNRRWYIYYGTGNEPVVHLGVMGFITAMFSLGLALGVVISVGTLFVIQIRGILKNETGIEDWIVKKAMLSHPRSTGETFVYPYNLGWKRNLFQVFTWSCQPAGDGIEWTILDDCDQYSLTREQMRQKEEKKLRTREYTIMDNFSGSWFPISKGFAVCCNPPYSDEPRIKLIKGNRVLVTRWKKYWLYGEKIIEEVEYTQTPDAVVRVRGWFPRMCAVEIINGNPDYPSHNPLETSKTKKAS